MTTRVLLLAGIVALGVPGCAKKFGAEEISGYVGTWAYSISSVNVSCSDGTKQSSSGSGQIVLSVASDDPTALEVGESSLCNASPELSPQPDGFDLIGSVPCPADAGLSGTLTQYHVAIDSHHPDTLLFSRTTSTTLVSGTTCSTAENGTATRS